MPRLPRLGVLLAATTVGLGALAGVPSAPAAASRTTTVTVLLAAPHPAALRRLGSRGHLTRAQRQTRLAPLLPSARTRKRVAARLRHEGLTVTGRSTWTLTATAPATTVTEVLGTTTASGARSRSSRLGPGVASVVDAGSGPRFHALATPTTGRSYRSAYAPVGATASSGLNDGASTVATVQLSDWDPADLSYYATDVLGVADPVGSGQYTQVDVGGGTTDTSGQDEVILDQEAILATAPSARQRAYVAPNSLDGFVGALSGVASDAATHHITAVSISWGGCETGAWYPDEIDAMEDVLASVTAAGVTVFSASGDSGIYDCGDLSGNAAVDYPASSPQVVGVGGTTLTRTGSATPDNGANWAETGWSCGGPNDCPRNGGSGGGASARFARPVWQTNTMASSYGPPVRMVPDIAAVAAPSTGFRQYDATGASAVAGGTSLASPVAAASFANALGDAGVSSHVGDIHQALYAAHQQAAGTVFRDVTSGQNGYEGSAGNVPSVFAGPGYDTVTGLGSVYWRALLPYLGATTAPPTPPAPAPVPSTWVPNGWTPPTPPDTGPTAEIALNLRKHAGRRRQVQAVWGTRTTIAAWSATTVTMQDMTTHKVLWTGSGYSGTHVLRARVGHVVRLTVSAVDVNGRGLPSILQRRVR